MLSISYYHLCLIYSRAMLFTVLMDRYSACFPCTEMEICILNWVDWPLGFDFSINLTDSLDSDLSLESGWDNNHCCINFRQNWANSQNDNFFHPGIIWVKIVILWIYSVLSKGLTTVIIFSDWLRSQIWVKWVSESIT